MHVEKVEIRLAGGVGCAEQKHGGTGDCAVRLREVGGVEGVVVLEDGRLALGEELLDIDGAGVGEEVVEAGVGADGVEDGEGIGGVGF